MGPTDTNRADPPSSCADIAKIPRFMESTARGSNFEFTAESRQLDKRLLVASALVAATLMTLLWSWMTYDHVRTGSRRQDCVRYVDVSIRS
ncbi:hypothetical protein NEOLEDRAFT_1139642 [Neolentinus lepideus HHB14362 ss-1]|uniref:Uncharacterized protein n=1 Tax=Neolentinus lepideus HHB14362 ss-1 TaxID=1314782 RepID=A0A165PP09_9AGAM|nr:hypothetical protein NEOLEDRAFT_1139642 [Neolentinus lepideus HHB14362 ss-1]